MLPVDIVAIAASLLVLHIWFGRKLPRSYSATRLTPPTDAILDRLTFHVGWIVLLATLAGFFALDGFRVPTSSVAGPVDGHLLLVAWPYLACGPRKVLRTTTDHTVYVSHGLSPFL